MKRKAQKAFAGTAAVIAAIYGTTMLRSVGYGAWFLLDSGSGGIGAVSSGLFEALVPLATAAMVNRVLVRWARRAGGVVLVLHRAHSIVLLLLPVPLVLSVILFAGIGVRPDVRLSIAFGLIAGFTLAVQLLLLAVILAFFATHEQVSAT